MRSEVHTQCSLPAAETEPGGSLGHLCVTLTHSLGEEASAVRPKIRRGWEACLWHTHPWAGGPLQLSYAWHASPKGGSLVLPSRDSLACFKRAATKTLSSGEEKEKGRAAGKGVCTSAAAGFVQCRHRDCPLGGASWSSVWLNRQVHKSFTGAQSGPVGSLLLGRHLVGSPLEPGGFCCHAVPTTCWCLMPSVW